MLRRRIAAALDRRSLAANEDDDVPTSSLLPTRGEAQLIVKRPSLATSPLTLRMAVESDCWKCQQLVGLIAGQLRQVGITVTPVGVARVGTAMREPRSRIDLAALSTELPFSDPASFLTQMLGHDVPQSWVPTATFAAVKRLNRLSGRERSRAAVNLARQLTTNDVPAVAYGAPRIGLLLGPKLGCRHWDAFDFELDLSALCLTAAR